MSTRKTRIEVIGRVVLVNTASELVGRRRTSGWMYVTATVDRFRLDKDKQLSVSYDHARNHAAESKRYCSFNKTNTTWGRIEYTATS